MTLEGKKKYTAALIAIIGTIVIQFAPEQEDVVMQVVTTLAPLLVGGIYILTQGQHDKKKEEVKIEHEKSFQAEKAVILPVSIEQPDPAVMIDEWDLPEFTELDRRASMKAETDYFEANPMTNFFAAPSVMRNIKCVSIEQALAAWGWYEDKAEAAFAAKFGFPFGEAEEHLADDKTCPYYSVDNMARQKSIHHWSMLRKVRKVKNSMEDLEDLDELQIDWSSGLAPKDRNLFTVGNYAKYLIENFYRREKV